MINWKAVPALRVLAPLSAGILLAVLLSHYFSISAVLSILLLPILIVLSRLKKRAYITRWWFGCCLSLFWLLAGYGLVGIHDEYYRSDYFARYLRPEGEQQLILLIDEPPLRKNKVKLSATVLRCNNQSSCGRLLCYLDTAGVSTNLRYGDVIAVNARMQPISPPANPYAYDFQKAMKLKDVRFSAFAKGDEVQLLATNRANPIMGFAIRTQGELIKVMGQYVTDADALSVGSALILGYRSDISDEITQAYVNTGAMHVLSVSGLHVGLVASLIGWLLGRRSGGGKYRKTTDALVQLVLVWGFALITGASSCVLRAAVMFGFMIVGKAFSRDTNIYNALLASAFFLLLYNPYFLFDVGFQLSYLGLLGILYFHPYIYKFGIERVAWFSEFYLINQIWNLTAVSFAAMLTTTPLSLYYFHQFPVHFWLSGLVVVPLSTLVLYLGLFLFAIFKWSLLGVWTGKLLQLLILFMNQSLHFIEQIPPGVLRDFWMESFEVVVWYLVLGMLAAALYRRQLYWLKSALIWSIFLALYGEMVNYRATNQHLLVVYDAGPELLMDFFEGRQIKSIGTDGLSEKQEKFTAANNRIAHRVASAPEKRVQLASDTTASKMYSLQGKNILLLMGEALPESIPLGTTIDLLVVYNCAGLNLEKLAAEIHIKKVVFTGKIRAKAMEQFAGECPRLGMKFHDTGSRGAFTLQL